MNIPTYLAQLAGQLGCTYVPKSTMFKGDRISNQKGAVIGARRGYVVALALTLSGKNQGFAVMVRFPPTPAMEQMQEAVKSIPGFSSFLHKKSVAAIDNGLVVSWYVAMNKPKQEDVINLLDTVLEEISRYVPAFNGKCEDCGSAEVREITLLNGVPGYHCLSCQMRMAEERRREAEQYKALEANYAGGLMAGILVAAIVGTAWGELSGWMEVGRDKWYPQLHALITFFMSGAICWAFFKATGKRDRTGQALAAGLTLAAKWWGDALYYTHVIAHIRGIPFTAPLLVATLRHFFDYKFSTGMHRLVLASDLIIAALTPWMFWGRLPKFEAVFQTVNPDGSLTQTLVQKAAAQ